MDIHKRYYSIGEVSSELGVTRSVIRYWEKEFSFIKPYKNNRGERKFTRKNIDQLKMIHHLVKERGFTIKGAKSELHRALGEQKNRLAVMDQLTDIRNGLEGLVKELDQA